MSCHDGDRRQCPECQAPRPGKRWPSVADCPYPFLGDTVDGRYLVDRFVGSGTSGNIYRARSLGANRQLAIKVIDLRRFNDRSRQEMIDRFYREVDAVGQIKNPHVIDVFEALQLDEAIFGLVMDYIDGPTLDVLLDEREHLSVDDAVSITIQIANGLHEAHTRGIIHRDIKPENIIVEQLPASGLFARILDFGIAQVDGDSDDYGFQGTPLYASPEQCTEERRPDARSDIYSLGCLFYHLLTGQPPFAYTNALRVMDAHVEAPRPRLADAADLEFEESLEHLVAHMLARDPDDRPTSLDVVHRELKAFERGQPLSTLGTAPDVETPPPQGFDSDHGAATPPSNQFISLSERTSTELADDSTVPDAPPLARWQPDEAVTITEIDERSFGGIDRNLQSALTASVLDRRGLACALADATPSARLIGLGDASLETTFDHDTVISAVDVDVQHGLFLVADVGGTLIEVDPGQGRPVMRHELATPPLALELLPAKRTVYFGNARGRLQCLDLRTDSNHEIARFAQAISTLHSDADGSLIAGLWDGSVARIEDGRLRWHRPVAPDAIADTGIFDGDRYFATDGQGTIHIGDLQRGHRQISAEIGPGLRTTRRLDDGQLMGLSLFDGQLQTWHIDIES